MLLACDFADQDPGLAAMHYRVYDKTGGVVIARTQVGIIDLGAGAYMVDAPIAHGFEGVVIWDGGGKKAIDTIQPGAAAIIPQAPASPPVIGVATLPEWIAFFAAWSVNEVDSYNNLLALRNHDNTADLAHYPLSDNGVVYVYGGATTP